MNTVGGVVDAGIDIREVTKADAEAISHLLDALDPQSRHRRWFTGAVDMPRAVEWAAHPEEARAVGLLAWAGEVVVGHGVLVPGAEGHAELAFEVDAAWRRHGVAGALLDALLIAAARCGWETVSAEVLAENVDVLAVLREHGGQSRAVDGQTVRVTLPRPRLPSHPHGLRGSRT